MKGERPVRTYKPFGGEHILTTARRMVALAKRTKGKVRANFNDIELIAKPGDSAKAIEAQYNLKSRLYRYDWTIDPETGRSNSSPEFLELVEVVERIIQNSAHDLVAGRPEKVARLILARLAHGYGLSPGWHKRG